MNPSKEKKYKCRFCPESFDNPQVRDQHEKYKHAELLNPSKTGSSQDKSDEPQVLINTKDNPPEVKASPEQKEEILAQEEADKLRKEQEKLRKEGEERSKAMGVEEDIKRMQKSISDLADLFKKGMSPVVEKAKQDMEKARGQETQRLMGEQAAKEAKKVVEPVKAEVASQQKELKTLQDQVAKFGVACNTIEECKVMLSDLTEKVKPKEEKPKEEKKSEKLKEAIPAGYIKEDEHRKMWQLLTECKEPGCGLEYVRKEMEKDPVLRGDVVKSLQTKEFELACTTPECKAEREKLLKEHGIEIRKKKGEKPGGFLTPGGEEWERL